MHTLSVRISICNSLIFSRREIFARNSPFVWYVFECQRSCVFFYSGPTPKNDAKPRNSDRSPDYLKKHHFCGLFLVFSFTRRVYRNDFQELNSMGTGFIGGFNTPYGNLKDIIISGISGSCVGDKCTLNDVCAPANEQIPSTFRFMFLLVLKRCTEDTSAEGMAMHACILT
jgi:hypothetical protein